MSSKDFYKNAKIYKIVDHTTDNIYIGSTCKLLCQRLSQHRQDYKRHLKGNFCNLRSFEIIKNGNYSIVLIENYPCETKEQLFQREAYYIEKMNCLNKLIPGKLLLLGEKNYNKDYYENHLEESKKYYLANKSKMLEKHQCECGGNYTTNHKNEHLTL